MGRTREGEEEEIDGNVEEALREGEEEEAGVEEVDAGEGAGEAERTEGG